VEPAPVGKLILLDRDGVINRDSDAFVKSASEFLPLPGAIDAIADLTRVGVRVAVCTNQSGIGRGLLTEADLARIHGKLIDLVEAAGGRIHGIRYCPHHPDDGCDCRKPSPAMPLALMNELNASPADTTVVGDSLRDLESGRMAGCRAVLVRTGNGAKIEAEARATGYEEVFDDLAAFSRSEIARIHAASGVQQ
jgi:D-glycero-D-manno-heptose 1,7-bisphosphate phosphatase